MFHEICEIIFIREYLGSIYRIFYLTQIKIISRSACISTKSLNENKKEGRISQPDLLGFIAGTIIQSIYLSLKKKPLGCSVRKISFSYKDMRDYVSPNSQFLLFSRFLTNAVRNVCMPFSFRSGNYYT